MRNIGIRFQLLWMKLRDKFTTYNKELVKYPQFFSTSSGMTENAIDVFSGDIPYLVSKESKGEEIAPKYKTEFL